MKRWKSSVAWLMVVSLLLSLFCVCALCFHPTHDADCAEHCVFCRVAAHVGTLLHSDARASSAAGVLLLSLLCLGLVATVWADDAFVPHRTLINLKTELLN